MIVAVVLLLSIICIGWIALVPNSSINFTVEPKPNNISSKSTNFSSISKSNERSNIRIIQRNRRAEFVEASFAEEKNLRKTSSNQIKQTTTNTPNGLLMTYLQAQDMVQALRQYIMFVWDADGKLIGHTPINAHKGWMTDTVIRNGYGQTSPSEYGKVALKLSSDVICILEEKLVPDPPIPILLYSIPNYKLLIENFTVIPTAYETNGLNEVFIKSIKRFLDKSFYATYEEFMNRKSIMVWRGAFHGFIERSRSLLVELNDAELQNASNKNVWLDASFATQASSDYTAESMIRDFRYHIDIGGVSGTSWGGLRWKMCGGGLVFKVNSWAKDLWHDTIEPWKHYIPVNDDLGNLREMYDWVQKNPTVAYRIAVSGQQKCLETYTAQDSLNVLSKIINDLPAAAEDTMVQARYYLDHHFDMFNV